MRSLNTAEAETEVLEIFNKVILGHATLVDPSAAVSRGETFASRQ
jgi:hypothetical protein